MCLNELSSIIIVPVLTCLESRGSFTPRMWCVAVPRGPLYYGVNDLNTVSRLDLTGALLTVAHRITTAAHEDNQSIKHGCQHAWTFSIKLLIGVSWLMSRRAADRDQPRRRRRLQ